jgi:hypothetical protein
MDANSDPDQAQKAEVLTTGSHVQLSITNSFISVLIRIKTLLTNYSTHVLVCTYFIASNKAILVSRACFPSVPNFEVLVWVEVPEPDPAHPYC